MIQQWSNSCDTHLAEVIIAVGHRLKTDQLPTNYRPISKIATHFLVWSDTCQIREEWLYIVVLTCVVGVADKNNTVMLLGDQQTRWGHCTLYYNHPWSCWSYEPYSKLCHKHKNGRPSGGTLVIFCMGGHWEKSLNCHISAKNEDIDL